MIVEILEAVGLIAVFAIGLVADAAGLTAAMYTFAAVPLLLPVVGRGMAAIEAAGPDNAR